MKQVFITTKKTLLYLISELGTLNGAWKAVRRNSSQYSHGPDGVFLKDFASEWHDSQTLLQKSIREGSYSFGGYRGVAIPKKAGASPEDLKAWRPISIAGIKDRIVQRAILDRIWIDIRDKVWTESSFGGIRKYLTTSKQIDYDSVSNPKRNIFGAVKRICELRAQGYQWVFETDIESFFPSINREILYSHLFPLRDTSVDELIKSSLDTSIKNNLELEELGSLWNPTLGVPQGGTLSPIFANLYLYKFDQEMEKAGFQLVRYVDDLIVLCKDKSQASAAYELSKSLLLKLKLNIHPLGKETNKRIKTNIHAPNERFDFLGLTFTPVTILPKQAKFDSLKEKIMEITDVKGNEEKLPSIIQSLNWCLKGWANSYEFCNLQKTDHLGIIDGWVNLYVRRWMHFRGLIPMKPELSPSAFEWLGLISATKFKIDPVLKAFASGKEAATAR